MSRMYLKMAKILLLLALGILLLSPLLFILIQSFAFSWPWPQILPKSLSIRGWEVLLKETKIVTALWSTMLIGGMVVILNLVIALPAAKVLAQDNFKGKALVETFLLMPILIPALGLAMGLHLTMVKLGLANQWIGVVLIHLIPTIPYSIRILRAGYMNLGVKWEEQARSLGVRPGQIFMTIYLPLLLPSLRSACILAFVISLSQYVLTALIGGGNVVTLAMIYYPYFTSVDRAVIAAFSLLFAIIPIFFLIIIEVFITLLIPGKTINPKGLNNDSFVRM